MKRGIFSGFFLILFFITDTAFCQKDFDSYEEGLSKFKSGDYAAVVDIYTSILANPDHSKNWTKIFIITVDSHTTIRVITGVRCQISIKAWCSITSTRQ